MTNAAIRASLLLVLLGLWLETSHSENPGSPKIDEEILRQESIYSSKGKERPRGYTIDRSLADYAQILSSSFEGALANLGPQDRWLDIGTGRGQAILDYYTSQYDVAHPEGRARRGKKARAVAISIEDRRTPAWREKAASLGDDQMQYLVNRRLREYSSDELGRFQLITDVVGGFSYTESLSLFMEKVLSLLEPNGSFYTLLQDVHSEEGSNLPFYKGAAYLTEILNGNGDEIRVCSWLKSATCVKVSCEYKPDWHPPIEVFHVQKLCDDTVVPPLATVHYEAGTPPERRFRLEPVKK